MRHSPDTPDMPRRARGALSLAVAASLSVAAIVALTALPGAAASAGAWSCTAYGVGGKRSQWQAVTGSAGDSRAAAEQSALAECARRGLNACRPSGCWPR